MGAGGNKSQHISRKASSNYDEHSSHGGESDHNIEDFNVNLNQPAATQHA